MRSWNPNVLLSRSKYAVPVAWNVWLAYSRRLARCALVRRTSRDVTGLNLDFVFMIRFCNTEHVRST